MISTKISLPNSPWSGPVLQIFCSSLKSFESFYKDPKNLHHTRVWDVAEIYTQDLLICRSPFFNIFVTKCKDFQSFRDAEFKFSSHPIFDFKMTPKHLHMFTWGTFSPNRIFMTSELVLKWMLKEKNCMMVCKRWKFLER